MRNTSVLPMIGMIFLGLLGYAGCDPDSPLVNDIANREIVAGRPISTTARVSTNTQAQSLPAKAQETLLIASFNIQVLGEDKMNDRWVMERIAEVIRRFDIVAIQEVRAKNQTLLPTLVNYVNAMGGRYDYLLGPRLGRSNSKEQYAYVYDASRVITSKDYSYTLNDDIDLLHREPLIARFVARTSLTNRPWSFSLVNLHTDPDEAVAEVEAMGSILREIRNYEFAAGQEEDVILLGDFNTGPEKMRNLQALAGMRPLIVNQPTNVMETKIYDNILIEPVANAEFTGLFGVLSLREFFGISMNDAAKLSDHNPVWAEFLVEERSSYSQQQMAIQPFVGVR
jgi:deoxyribonuclease-1-like protein